MNNNYSSLFDLLSQKLVSARFDHFLSVWIEDDHMFISIFHSPEFMKLMVNNRRPDLQNSPFLWDLWTP